MAQEVYQNPIAERANGIFKSEFLRPGYPNHQLALAAVKRAIWVYNTLRPHRSINMLKPVDAHLMSGAIPKRWKKNMWREKAKAQKSAMNQKKFLPLNLS